MLYFKQPQHVKGFQRKQYMSFTVYNSKHVLGLFPRPLIIYNDYLSQPQPHGWLFPFLKHIAYITEHIVEIKTVRHSVTFIQVHTFLQLYQKGFILIIQAGLLAKHQRPVERKHIKVTDLWPKNTPNHIPHNYRHQGMPAKETQPIYCGDLSTMHTEICLHCH